MEFKDYVGKRIEWGFWMMLFGLSAFINRFDILPANASCFVAGALTGLGAVLLVVSVLPQSVYDKLAYRKWVKKEARFAKS